MNKHPSNITAVILAGGQGSRMGGRDKGLIKLGQQPLIQHVINAISLQVDQLVINANRNAEQYQVFGYPIIADSMDSFQGPLAGILASMQQIETDNIVTVPCDGPLLPKDLVQRLIDARESEQSEIAVAHDGKRLQPVYALIHTRLEPSLRAYLNTGRRKIDSWYAQHRVSYVDFSDIPETFININTMEERDQLQAERRTA